MAGIVYWNGSASTACTTAGNWTAGAGGSTPPAAGDEVIIDDRANALFAPTTVCAVGNTGGIDYDLLHIKSGCTHNLGTTNAPFHTSAQKIIIEGSGTYYIEISEDATGKDQIVPLIIVNNSAATVYLSSNENSADWCCEVTNLIVFAGTVYIGHNGTSDVATAVKYLWSVPKGNTASNAVIYIKKDCIRSKATAYTMSVYMLNGTITCDSGLLLIDMAKGTFNYGTDLVASPEADLNIGTLRQCGGTFNWYPDDDGNPYIASLYLFGGTFDASASTNNDRAKVLGNGAGYDAYIFEGATLNISGSTGNVSIAASSKLITIGNPTILVGSNAQLAISYNLP